MWDGYRKWERYGMDSVWDGLGMDLHHRIIELLRLEKTLKIIKSNHDLTIQSQLLFKKSINKVFIAVIEKNSIMSF